MTATTDDVSNVPVLPAELLQSVCEALGVDHLDRASFSAELRSIGVAFAEGREVEHLWGVPGEQRTAIRRLIRSLENTLIALYSVTPEYLVAFEPLLDKAKPSSTDDLLTRTIDSLFAFHEAAVRFDERYKPNKGAPPDLVLEEAVRDLLDLFQDNGFGKPLVTPGREEQQPTFRNKEAKAIDCLLRGIDPKTEPRSIVNMVMAVNRRRRPSESHLEQIWRTDPDFELDLLISDDSTHEFKPAIDA